MTFAEAKARDDYKFKLNGVEDFIHDLKTGEFMNWTEYDERDGYFNYGEAILEIGYADIELNIETMCNGDGTGYINQPDPCYFMCVKGFNNGWCDAGYLDDIGDYPVCVNWSASDWVEQLERDMFENFMKAVREFDIKIDEPNWLDVDHEFDVFDRLHGIER